MSVVWWVSHVDYATERRLWLVGAETGARLRLGRYCTVLLVGACSSGGTVVSWEVSTVPSSCSGAGTGGASECGQVRARKASCEESKVRCGEAGSGKARSGKVRNPLFFSGDRVFCCARERDERVLGG